MSLIVFGGSFDPPHRAHLRLLRKGLQALKGASAVIVPAYHSPLKTSARVSGRERLGLIRSALNSNLPKQFRKRVSIDSFEIGRGRMTYTYETLRHLKRKHPGEKLYFLCGSDTVASLPKWAHPAEVAKNCTFLVGRRPGTRPPSKYSMKLLPGTFPRVSSSEIRFRMILGAPVKTFLNDSVASRIRSRGLYGIGIHKRLKLELNPNRYAHTLAVTRHAAAMAKLHGLNAEQAALAGLLHDCGRAIPMAKMVAFMRRNRIQMPALEETGRRQPMLMHAHASEFRARTVYGVEDAGVLSAIRKHTLGDSNMEALDRLLYAADASSSDRSYPGVGKIRSALRRDLDEGFAEAVRNKLSDVLKQGQWLHPSTAAVWNEAMESL